MSKNTDTPDVDNRIEMRMVLIWSGIVVGLAILILLVSSSFMDLSRIHIYSHLNDQVGYITTARNLQENGDLSSNIIYPSTLYQSTSKDYLYMPGYYYALATSYTLFGYGIFQSYLPNIISYILTSLCIFLIGKKLANIRVGLIGAILFMLFPINIIYSFTAMSEITLVFATTLVFCIFVYLPDRWRPYLVPILLFIPIFFKETGILIALPMALMIYKGVKKNIGITFVYLILSLIVGAFVLTSDVSSGRPSLLLANIFDGDFDAIYLDATVSQQLSPRLLDWPGTIASNISSNITQSIDLINTYGLSFDIILVSLVFIMMAIGIVYGIRMRDFFLIASGLFTFVTFLTILCFYTLHTYRGLRILLFTVPLNFLAVSYLYEEKIRKWLHNPFPRLQKYILPLLILGLGFASIYSVIRMENIFTSMDELDEQNSVFLESIGHDDNTLLIAPYDISLYYVYEHYPVKWSFVPSNPATMALLKKKYDIGTVIMPEDIYQNSFSSGELSKLHLSIDRTVTYQNNDYLILR